MPNGEPFSSFSQFFCVIFFSDWIQSVSVLCFIPRTAYNQLVVISTHPAVVYYDKFSGAQLAQKIGMMSCLPLWRSRRHDNPHNEPLPLWRHAYSNTCILKILPPKTGNFSDKKNSDIFHISAQNIDCGYSLDPPRQCMFLSRNNKNNVYPCKPQFYYIYIKVGFKGVKII